MTKQRYKQFKKHFKFLKKQVKEWEHYLDTAYETQLPYLRQQIRNYKRLLQNVKKVQEFLSEYYGKMAEAQYLFKKEKEKKE